MHKRFIAMLMEKSAYSNRTFSEGFIHSHLLPGVAQDASNAFICKIAQSLFCICRHRNQPDPTGWLFDIRLFTTNFE